MEVQCVSVVVLALQEACYRAAAIIRIDEILASYHGHRHQYGTMVRHSMKLRI